VVLRRRVQNGEQMNRAISRRTVSALAVAGALIGVWFGAGFDLGGAAARLSSPGLGPQLVGRRTPALSRGPSMVTLEPVAFSMRLSSFWLRFRGRPVVLSIRMRTAGSSATAAVGLTTSSWPDPGVLGVPLHVGSPRLSGPGTITGGFASGGAGQLAGVPVCFRGAVSPAGYGVDVSLPANTITTLTYTVRYAVAPWPRLRPTIGAFVNVPAVNNHGTRASSLGPMRLKTAGRSGVRISLSAPHAPELVPNAAERRVSRGRIVTIVGRTAPRLAHALVKVTAEYYAHPNLNTGLRQELIGTARSDRAGIFRVDWRPRSDGAYVIAAKPVSTHPASPQDVGCDLTLTVR
jgi:hypothetical protein